MSEKKSIAGVVVLFDPEENVVENINSYLDQIDLLFIVDNSKNFNETIADYYKNNSKVEYVYNGENLGIAAALNVGVKKAVGEGFKYLLTMDQDSKVPPDLVKNLLECFSLDSCIAIVSPEHYQNKNLQK